MTDDGILRFSRQNDAGLRALNVVLWENLVLVVVLVLESKGPYYKSVYTLVTPRLQLLQ